MSVTSKPISFYVNRDYLAVIELDGVFQNTMTEIGEFGYIQFVDKPCAVVKVSHDSIPVIGRLLLCQNYNARPTIGAIIRGELYRDVLGVRWPTSEDFALY